MVLDFLTRAYVPHVMLVAIAIVVFSSQPQWPEEEWHSGTRANASVDHRIVEGRLALYRAVLKRAVLLAILTAFSYLLSDSFTSVVGRQGLLPDIQSLLRLVGASMAGSLFLMFIACTDVRLAVALFIITDGVSLTGLLFVRNAYDTFAQGVRNAELLKEQYEKELHNREEDLRSGTPGARREVDQYYADHRDLLTDVFPEALFRSSMNAAIPEGAEPSQAWSAARELIATLQGAVASEKERAQQENGRKQAEAKRSVTHKSIRPEDV